MPNLFDSIGTHGGLLGMLTGRSDQSLASSLDSERYAQEQQQKAQQATYQSLLQSGAPEHVARAAALNPKEFGQFAAPYLDSAPKVQFVPDMYGNQIPMSVQGGAHPAVSQMPVGGNETSGTAGVGGVGNGALMEQVNQMRANGSTPEQIVETLPNSHPAKGMIKGLIEGRGLPTSLGMRAPARQAIMLLAQAMGLDEGAIKARMQYANDIGNTKSGEGFRLEAGAKALDLQERLLDQSLKLHNIDMPDNLLAAIPGVETGVTLLNNRKNQSSGNKAIATGMNDTAQTFAQEKGKLVSGVSGGAVSERAQTAGRYNSNSPRSGLAGVAADDLAQIQSQYHAMEARRDAMIGAGNTNKKFEIISPDVQERMKRIEQKIKMLKEDSGTEGSQGASAPRITTQEEYNKLPAGTTYMHPDGQLKTKK